MSRRITDTETAIVDAVLRLVFAVALGVVLLLVWLAAAGRLPSQEPPPVTWHTGNGDLVEVTP